MDRGDIKSYGLIKFPNDMYGIEIITAVSKLYLDIAKEDNVSMYAWPDDHQYIKDCMDKSKEKVLLFFGKLQQFVELGIPWSCCTLSKPTIPEGTVNIFF